MRSSVFAGGIVASGVFDFTEPTPVPASETLGAMTVIVTWGGDNDKYAGSTPSGVSVPAFSFVEQASLASKYYAAEPNVDQVQCRGIAEVGRLPGRKLGCRLPALGQVSVVHLGHQLRADGEGQPPGRTPIARRDESERDIGSHATPHATDMGQQIWVQHAPKALRDG
jgi:hypothetical protein